MTEPFDFQRRRSLRLLLGAAASLALPSLAWGDADASFAAALAVLQDRQATAEQKEAAGAVFTLRPVSLMVSGGTLKDAFVQLFGQAAQPLTMHVAADFSIPVSVKRWGRCRQ